MTLKSPNAIDALSQYVDESDDEDDVVDDDVRDERERGGASALARVAKASDARDATRALPRGWHAARESDSGKIYYYNKRLNLTQWCRPRAREGTEGIGEEDDDGAREKDASEARADASLEVSRDVREWISNETSSFDGEKFALTVREAMEGMERKCRGVAEACAKTPEAAFAYRALRDIYRWAQSLHERDVPGKDFLYEVRANEMRLRDVRDGLDVAAAAYEETVADDFAEDDFAEDDFAGDDGGEEEGVPEPPPMPEGSMISAPPAPAVVVDVGRTMRAEAAPRKRSIAAVSDVKAHRGNMSKWAKIREIEDDARDGAKVSVALEAKRARELEAWRADQIRSGAGAGKNPNFVPVGDWRTRVEAAKARDKLDEFRELRERGVGGENDKATASVNALANASESEEKPLPPGWRAFFDEASGDTYYGNLQTKETSWDRPSA